MAYVGAGLFGGYKTIGGQINSDIGGATKGLATQTNEKIDNSSYQTGIIDNSVTDNISKDNSLSTTTNTSVNPFGNNSSVQSYDSLKQIGNNTLTYEVGGFGNGQVLVNGLFSEKSPDYYLAQDMKQSVKQNKNSNSGAGIDVNYMFNMNEVENIGNTLFKYADVIPDAIPKVKEYQSAIMQASNAGDINKVQDLVTQYKLYLGTISGNVLGYMYGNNLSDSIDYKVLQNYNTNMGKLQWTYENSGDSIYNYANLASQDIVKQKIVNPATTGSRNAKDELRNNPYYLDMLKSIEKTSPVLYAQLGIDYNADTMTSLEKDVIREMKTKYIQPQQDAYNQYKELYGYAEAEKVFANVKPLLSLQYLEYDTLWDDIIGDTFNSLSNSYVSFSNPGQSMLSYGNNNQLNNVLGNYTYDNYSRNTEGGISF